MNTRIVRLVFKVALLGVGALAVGCDDPVPPSAQGAVKYRLGRQPTGLACSASAPSETIGSINVNDLTQSAPLVNDEGGKVSCRVKPSGNSYNVNVSLQQGPNLFALSGTVTPGEVSKVIVNLTADSIKATYSTNPDNACLLRVDGTTPAGLGISPGKIRAIFDCPEMILSGAAIDAPRCAIAGATSDEPGGYIFFDNCDE
jgi:hypothetical protein